MFRVLLVVFLALSGPVFSAEYVGSQQCKTCHVAQYNDWHQSHHDHAMEEATAETVLADFSNASFEYNGITSRFTTRKNGTNTEFWIKTDNANGELQDFRVDYTFGVYPLQQYLTKFDDGRYQSHTLSWDSRPKKEGGQRWFHLYPDDPIDADDPLHWTGPYFTWNNRCADCHSTNLQKNYQPETNTYSTTWSEIDVACEACHGRGSDHIDWVSAGKTTAVPHKGFAERLAPLSVAEVLVQARTDKAIDLSHSEAQIAVCGSCHSRRSVIGDITAAGNFHNKHRLSLLDQPLYHADGQILDEVYVLGSFLQSKMYHQGVVCSHCHNPHSLAPKYEGNALCTQCHAPSQYDVVAHHHHETTSSGAQCVNCHMPETTYMVVDPRRDHSFKIPRPDLSEQQGTPNACTQCHTEKSNQWAGGVFKKWLKEQGKNAPNSPPLMGSDMSSEALQRLLASHIPSIMQATALGQLAQRDSTLAIASAKPKLLDDSPLVRAAAVRALKPLPFTQRYAALKALIVDNNASVRLAVAESLSSSGLMQGRFGLSEAALQQLDELLKEYEQALLFDQDSASGLLNLGVFYVAQNDYAKAEAAYLKALDFEPHYIPASLNLADVYREQGNNGNALNVLDAAIQINPDSADIQHALGLALVRAQRHRLALKYLSQAAGENFRYGYVYAVALHSLGDYPGAVAEVQRLIAIQPTNAELLSVGLDASLKSNQLYDAYDFAQKLAQINPQDLTIQQLLQNLERRL